MTWLLGLGFRTASRGWIQSARDLLTNGDAARRARRAPRTISRRPRRRSAQDAGQADVDLARDQSRDRPDARARQRQLLAHLAPHAVRDRLAHVLDAPLRGRAADAEHLADLFGGRPLDRKSVV